MSSIRTLKLRSNRDGNVLVGCLVALGIAFVLLIIATVLVWNSWRGIISGVIQGGVTQGLNKTQISQVEKDEINTHIDALMIRFEAEDVSWKDLTLITVELFEGPLLPAGIVAASYEVYFADSELEDDVKADAQLQLSRVAHGMFTETIDMAQLEAVLEPIEAGAISSGSSVQINTGEYQINLKDADAVTTEELLELIANARAAADEAGVDQVPVAIDLSNEVAFAIANALGEDPSLWLPEGAQAHVRAENDNADESLDDDNADDAGADSDDDDNDGP